MDKKKLATAWIWTIARMICILAMPALAPAETVVDKTESPYFFVKSDDPAVDQLPLQSTRVDVVISGVIANVTVTQAYQNKGKKPLSAVYIFPASTKAAVYGMKMTIGSRTVTANIKKTLEAREDYEAAKAAGKTASLLVQHRPNVFAMNVANILPRDIILVELKYTELVVPINKIYAFVYPTVVGPRYNHDPASDPAGSNPWVRNPYLGQGELSKSAFEMQILLNGAVPLKDVTCPSHAVNIDFKTPTRARIVLDAADQNSGNRDFILKYRLAGNKIQTGLLLSGGEKENFFLMMIQPPEQLRTEDIPPREYIFIVDVSGSMYGFPLDIAKKLTKNLVGNLRPSDRFNMLLFSGGSSVLSPESLPAKAENIQKAISFIDQQRGGGGTNLLPALKKAFDMSTDRGLSRTLIVVTDGYVTVEEEAFDMIRNRLNDANLFAFGIGSSVNRHLIEGMARVGYGEPFVITQPEEADRIADTFRKLVQSPVLTDISIDFGQFDVYDVEPKTIPDVMADRPILVFGKWRGRPQGRITVKGVMGDKAFSRITNLTTVQPDKGNTGLHYIWARHKIALLSDYVQLRPTDARIDTITQLGLDHNLLTAYTSFVAVDSEIRLENGASVTVHQPLPLPQGVSNSAVGGRGLFAAGAMPGKSLADFSVQEPVHGLVQGSEIVQKEGRGQASDQDEAKKDKEEKTQCLRTLEVSAGLSREKTGEILKALAKKLKACDPSQTGLPPLTLVIAIDKTGRVTRATVSVKDLVDPVVKKCLEEEIFRQVFPSPANGREGKISAVLVF